MSSSHDLYPSRDRSTNVELIRNLLAAHNQEEYEAADARVAVGLHPSLFAELDWMEMSVRPQDQVGAIRLVDGLFVHHLPAIMSQRKVEFDLLGEDLQWELSANHGFYEVLLRDAKRPLDELGSQLSQRIRDCLKCLEPDTAAAISAIRRSERSRIVADFSTVEDPNWILPMVSVEIENAFATALDHIASRMQTKQFMRHIGGRFPNMGITSVDSNADLQSLLDSLGDLEARAREFSICRLAAVCSVIHEVLVGMDASRLNAYSGELASGYGPCGNCSMMYASSALASYDPSCPRLFESEGGRITVPLDFNVSVCPFCGNQSRANTPAMFYSPRRNQIIYNYPRLGQHTEEEARETCRPMISALREQYLRRLGGVEAERFQAATEESTYSFTDFLWAIQIGTTAKEEHVYNVVRLGDGSGLIVDATKGVIIALTPTEMVGLGEEAHDLATVLAAQKNEGAESGPTLGEAMEAFAAGRYERSRDMLEELHKRYPRDQVIRRNLATAYVTLGDKESARRVLGG